MSTRFFVKASKLLLRSQEGKNARATHHLFTSFHVQLLLKKITEHPVKHGISIYHAIINSTYQTNNHTTAHKTKSEDAYGFLSNPKILFVIERFLLFALTFCALLRNVLVSFAVKYADEIVHSNIPNSWPFRRIGLEMTVL